MNPRDVSNQKQLFIDDRFIAESDHVKLTISPPVKTGIVLDTDKPWDKGVYRAYYQCYEVGKEGKFGAMHFCLATSTDGICWKKPQLGLVEFNGSKNNNILPGLGGHVFIDPKASMDKRYKYITEIKNWGDKDTGGVWLAYSADGLTWTFNKHRQLPFGCDTWNIVIYDTRIDKYVAYLRSWRKDPVLREIARVE